MATRVSWSAGTIVSRSPEPGRYFISCHICSARFVGFVGKELCSLQASAKTRAKAGPAALKQCPAQPCFRAFGARVLIPGTNRPPAPPLAAQKTC